ncbi:hydroxypyruvate isomerase family protein [Altibacter sp. HG106]|uniref:hydroxypyruvate isomerase family protein n=1 Tax=Altibacter sp. HG106 TaxID=3023937 RepID=UPI0023501FDE|nr:TIM barrel protein [Altibacter sp. HG106]MDC7994849.1 TIM barrel protein [Altibacter sp. HG106]
MNRRSFIQKGALAGSLLTFTSPLLAHALETSWHDTKYSFKLPYAPHIGMFKAHAGDDVVAQLEFMASEGFTAFEDNEMAQRSVAEQERMAAAMKRLKMTMGVFVAHKIYWSEPNLTSGKPEWRAEFLQHIRDSITVAKRVGATWMTVVPGHVDLHLNSAYQTANVVETLKQAAALLEPHKLVMVLEPLNFRNHPGQFLKESPQAFQICKAVASPSCKILYDVYHQQIQEGNLIPNLEACWEEIAYIQVGDNPGRNEPTTGEINYRNLFKYLHEKGYQGVIGMEHGNSQTGKEGERAVIEAYKKVDAF